MSKDGMMEKLLESYIAQHAGESHQVKLGENGFQTLSPLDAHRSSQLLIPFGKTELFKAALAEEREFVGKARSRRFWHRAGTVFFAGIILGLMLYNAFSNRSAMRRAGQTGDLAAVDRLYLQDPQYLAAEKALAAQERTLDAREAESVRKIEKYRTEGKEQRVSYWLDQQLAVQRERSAATAKRDSVASMLKGKAAMAVAVQGDYLFHELFGFALPVMVFLCALGAERLRDGRSGIFWAAMFLLQIPNAFLVQASLAHAFSSGAFILPGIGRTSPFALIVGLAVLLGEPLAYYVASSFMTRLLEGWHEALQKVVEGRDEVVRLRSAIRRDIQQAHEEVIEAQLQIAEKALRVQQEAAERNAEAASNMKHSQELVARTIDEHELDAQMPRATSPVELARKIVSMNQDVQYKGFLTRTTLAAIAQANSINESSLRAALHNLKKQNGVAANDEAEGGEE